MTDTTVLSATRILVALDTSERGRAALEAAVRLALNTSAELQGLFVEDEDLMRLASLPFACEVDVASASPRELHAVNMEVALRVAAEDAQEIFASALQQAHLQSTFRVVRGRLAQASLAAAADVDLLIIGQQGRSPRIIASEYMPRRPESRKRVVTVFDGSPSAFRMLEIGHRLAQAGSHELSVFVLAKNGDEVTQRCMTWLQERGIRAELYPLPDPAADAVIDLAKRRSPSVLLLNRDSEFVTAAQLCRLVNEADCPLILC